MKCKFFMTGIYSIFHAGLLHGQDNNVFGFAESFSLAQKYALHQFQINGFLAVTAGIFIVNKRRNFILRKRYRKLVSNLSNDYKKKVQKESRDSSVSKAVDNLLIQNVFQKMFSTSMEKRIAEGLNHFKQSEKFLDKETSLETLLNDLNVEFRYLQEVIMKHESVSAELYLHRLRIDFIIKKLFDHPKYRDYKSADLGSMCGYHSAGEFESYFQKSCKISLIYFLEQLKKDHDKKYRNKSKAA